MSLCCLAAAFYLAVLPSFRFLNLFRHASLKPAVIFCFPATDAAPQPAMVRTRGAFLGPLGPDRSPAYKLDGMEGTLEIAAPPPGESFVTVRVDLLGMAIGSAEVALEIPSTASRRVLTRESHMRQGFFRIDPWLLPGQPYRISVKALGGPVVLERLEVLQIPKREGIPPLDRMVLVVCLVGLLAASLPAARRRLIPLATITAVPLLLAALGQMTEIGLLASSWFWLALVVSVVAYRRRFSKKVAGEPWREWLLVVMLLGLVLRWSRLMGQALEPLDGDPLVYYTWGQGLQWANPFATGIREPFFSWMLRLGMFLFGPNPYQTRLVSLLLSLTTVFLTYRLAWVLSSQRLTSWIAALIMSISAFAVYASTGAERTQSFEPLVLLFCLVMIEPGEWTRRRMLGAILVGAALTLNWMIGIVAIPCFLGFLVMTRRLAAGRALVILGLGALLLTPYWYSSTKLNGSALAALNVHADYYKRVELEGVHAYGKKTTWVQYLLKDRGPGPLLRRTSAGYLSLFFNPSDRCNRIFMGGHYWDRYSYWLFPFYLMGFLLELFRRRFLALAMLASFLNIAPYFSQEILSPRYIFYIAPFFAYWIACGFTALWERAPGRK